MWGKRGESVAPYLKKGGQVVASLSEVHIQTREHEGKTYTDLAGRVEDVKLVNAPKPAAAAPPAAPAKPKQVIPAGDGFSDDLSDLPF